MIADGETKVPSLPTFMPNLAQYARRTRQECRSTLYTVVVLLRFRVSNHRSILHPVELSMIAVDKERAATRGFDLLPERVLTVAGIYGPNASGKSNVLDAIAWLSMAVARSLRGWDDDLPRDAHRFGKGPSSPSVFDLDLMVGGVRYAYQLEVEDSAVTYESLDAYPERRRRNLFTRHGEEIDFRRGLDGARGMRELLTPTTLVLSTAMRLANSDMRHVGRAIAGMKVLGLHRRERHSYSFSDSTMRILFNEVERVEARTDVPLANAAAETIELLRFADPGIDSFKWVRRESPTGEGSERRLRLIHRVGGEPIAFDLKDESAGTQMWFRLIGPARAALRDGRTLLFDEIDASLHPRLSARLIEIFRDPQTNPSGAQLVFTSHDASLLNTLNRDEVWFTEKGADGTTHLVALAEFGGERVRKSLNLERAYLQGRFGAIPEIDQAEVRDALGLVSRRSDG